MLALLLPPQLPQALQRMSQHPGRLQIFQPSSSPFTADREEPRSAATAALGVCSPGSDFAAALNWTLLVFCVDQSSRMARSDQRLPLEHSRVGAAGRRT